MKAIKVLILVLLTASWFIALGAKAVYAAKPTMLDIVPPATTQMR
jgi:hypothetical protein